MKRIFICALALCLLLCGCAEESSGRRRKSKKETETTETTETGATVEISEDAVADFTVYTDEGDEVRLSDFFGKPIVLNFWASWCNPCMAEMPDMQEAYEELGDEVVFVMVNLTTSDRKTDAQAVLEENGYTFPVYYDTDGDAATAYEIQAIPSSFFINRDGSLAASYVGTLSESMLADYLEQILE